MHRQFQPIFHIEVTHDKYAPPGEPPTNEYFRVRPTPETLALMRRVNWLFKSLPNGGFVVAERLVRPDGSFHVLRKLSGPTALTFRLELLRPDILLKTPPFDDTATAQPAVSGRTRVLYFDNLDSNKQPVSTLLSAQAKVGRDDFASLAPNRFRLAAPGNALSVAFKPLRPGGVNVPVAFPAPARSALVDLPSEAWRMEPGAAGAGETLITDSALLQMGAWGIIRIFKDENLDYDAPAAHYQLRFAGS